MTERDGPLEVTGGVLEQFVDLCSGDGLNDFIITLGLFVAGKRLTYCFYLVEVSGLEPPTCTLRRDRFLLTCHNN